MVASASSLVVNGIIISSYFSAGDMMVSETLTRAAKAAADLIWLLMAGRVK